MKIALMAIGKVAWAPVAEIVDTYAARIGHYMPFEMLSLPDAKRARGMTQDQQKAAEGKLMLAAVRPGDYLMLLDERGRELTSRQLSEFIQQKACTLPGRLVLAIGGPYGFSEEVYARADGKLSLSKLTFPHEIARALVVEQLYRAMTILRGEPYHHD